MITGELRSKIDAIWDNFWSGGISNPLEVMDQLTYLLFIKGLDEQQTRAENKAAQTGKPIETPVFPEGNDGNGRPYEDLRWSRFKNLAAAEMSVQHRHGRQGARAPHDQRGQGRRR